MATVKVTDESFDADVLKSSTPVLVDFWAEWCGPCKQIGPALEQIADELGGKVTVAKINIDDSPMTPSKLGVKGIPTLMLFKDGQMTSMKVGAMPKGKIVEWLGDRTLTEADRAEVGASLSSCMTFKPNQSPFTSDKPPIRRIALRK